MKLLKIINIFQASDDGVTHGAARKKITIQKTFECLHVNKFTLNYFPRVALTSSSKCPPRRSIIIIMQPNILENKQTIFILKNYAVRL